MAGKQPTGTPTTTAAGFLLQFVMDYWKEIVMVVEALVIVVLASRLLGLW